MDFFLTSAWIFSGNFSVADIRAWVLIEGNFGEELGNFEEDSVAAENLFSVEIFLGQRGNFSTV